MYPNSSTYAKLLVTDLGKEGVQYAKISPYCEIAIAPKVRKKEDESSTAKSISSSKSTKKNSSGEDYSELPLILKRGISLPHGLYDVKNDKGYVDIWM